MRSDTTDRTGINPMDDDGCPNTSGATQAQGSSESLALSPQDEMRADLHTRTSSVKNTTKPLNAIRIGCAGWPFAKNTQASSSAEGTHLMRYAERFPAVEINSSFYRPHKPATYAKWAADATEDFRFAVKVPKEATHTRRLADAEDVLDHFLPEATSARRQTRAAARPAPAEPRVRHRRCGHVLLRPAGAVRRAGHS